MGQNGSPADHEGTYLERVDHELQRLRHIIVAGAIPSEAVGEIFLLGMEAHPLSSAASPSGLPN